MAQRRAGGVPAAACAPCVGAAAGAMTGAASCFRSAPRVRKTARGGVGIFEVDPER